MPYTKTFLILVKFLSILSVIYLTIILSVGIANNIRINDSREVILDTNKRVAALQNTVDSIKTILNDKLK